MLWPHIGHVSFMSMTVTTASRLNDTSTRVTPQVAFCFAKSCRTK